MGAGGEIAEVLVKARGDLRWDGASSPKTLSSDGLDS
jgi:hypothetical protein